MHMITADTVIIPTTTSPIYNQHQAGTEGSSLVAFTSYSMYSVLPLNHYYSFVKCQAAGHLSIARELQRVSVL